MASSTFEKINGRFYVRVTSGRAKILVQALDIALESASCLNRARAIAHSLNHINMSSDHLMLALTMDPNARRLLERVGDVTQLRESAMQRLGKIHSRFSQDIAERSTSPTSDLVDIAKMAREAAAERDQSVAISDLINAFSKANGRLTYGSGDGSQPTALMTKIEQGLVPRVADAVTRIEDAVRDAMQRQQTAQSMLQDLSSRHWEESERRQKEFMDEIRRQVRESADVQIAAVLKDFNDKLDTKLNELKEAQEPQPRAQQDVPRPKGGTWNWLGLF